MIRTIILFALLFLSTLYAQDKKKIELTISGGFSNPITPDEFDDYWNIGFHAFGGIGYIMAPGVVINGSIGYNKFGLNTDEFLKSLGTSETGKSIEGGSIFILLISINVRGHLIQDLEEVKPYILGGIGYFIKSTDDIIISSDGINESISMETENAIGLNGGVGVEFPLSITSSFFIEAGYCMGLTERNDTNFFSIKGGIYVQI